MRVSPFWEKLGGVFVIALSVALLVVAVAISAPGDPRRLLTPADQTRARSLVLRTTDLPAGAWKASPTDFSQPNPPCIVRRYPFDSLTESGLAGFDYSNRAAALSVESDGSLFLTAAQSRRAFAISSQAGFNRCYADSLIAALPPSLTAKIVKLERVRRAAPGVALTAFRILISVQPASGNGLLEIVFAFMQRGRALSSVAIIRGGVSIPVSLRNGLIDRTAFKLRRL